MKISRSHFEEACIRVDLEAEMSEKLWYELAKDNTSKFNVEHLAYYFGAVIVMSAMGWFMTNAWDQVGGLGISLLGVTYLVIFFFLGRYLWFRKELWVAGGLLYTLAVWMVPLVVFGLEKYSGLWPQEPEEGFQSYHTLVRGSWIIMEVATIIAGVIALKYIRFPFLTFPVAFSLWYLSMDLTPIIFGVEEFTWEQRQLVSVYFGLAMIIGTYFLDRRTKEDYAFWGYLFGLMAFWGGLSSMNSDSELNKLLYCLINLFMIFVSVILQRKVFLVFGGMGVFAYLGHLAFKVFEDSLLFPVALSLLGVAIIYAGLFYNKNKQKIEDGIRHALPSFLLNLNPAKRENH